tara:strand:- start:270 stop:536 length:267 start_codon:yes stop_codon:yes gene_type:complete
MLTCLIKDTTGHDCPGCGTQRAFFKLIEGELLESFFLQPGLIPFIFLILFTPFHLKFMFKNGSKIILFLFIFSTSLTMINFAFKLITI